MLDVDADIDAPLAHKSHIDQLRSFQVWTAKSDRCSLDYTRTAVARIRDTALLSLLPSLPYVDLLPALTELGAIDLSLGRLVEGHVNAVELLVRLGTIAQKRSLDLALSRGELFAVWNTDGEIPVRLDQHQKRLEGIKVFASGCDLVDHAVITAELPAGKHLLVVKRAQEYESDPANWQPYGMERSGSGSANFAGVELEPGMVVGRPDDYHLQPWFSAGAVRFAAVQLGGAKALAELSIAELIRRKRADDPYQCHRIASLKMSLETGILWRDESARRYDQIGNRDEAGGDVVTYANMTRLAIEQVCLDVLDISLKAVGVSGLLRPNPFEQIYRDLTTYLRQPNPDGCLAAVGAAAIAAAS